jgi:hypothetical protein
MVFYVKFYQKNKSLYKRARNILTRLIKELVLAYRKNFLIWNFHTT